MSFDDAWANRMVVELGGVSVNVLSKHDLIVNKRAAARPKDLADVVYLESDGDDEI